MPAPTRAHRRMPATHRAAARVALAPLMTALVACGPLGAAGEAAVPHPLPFDLPGDSRTGPPQEHAWVIFGADTVVAEIAATPQARERGLMFRDAVPEGTGMLFVFPEAAIRGFWMDNTPVALDIAFLDASFRVVDLARMEPLSTEVRESRVPFVYALEVPRGWFEARGIGVGTEARIEYRPPPAPPAPDDQPAAAAARARASASTSDVSL